MPVVATGLARNLGRSRHATEVDGNLSFQRRSIGRDSPADYQGLQTVASGPSACSSNSHRREREASVV